MKGDPRVVVDTVRGIIICLKYCGEVNPPSTKFKDLEQFVKPFVCRESWYWIEQFCKPDINPRHPLIPYVMNEGPTENYEQIWNVVNQTLKREGYPRHEPAALIIPTTFECELAPVKSNLEWIIELVTNEGDPWVITKRDKPVAVIVAYEELERLKELVAASQGPIVEANIVN